MIRREERAREKRKVEEKREREYFCKDRERRNGDGPAVEMG